LLAFSDTHQRSEMNPEIVRALGWGLVTASAQAAALGCLVLAVRSVLRGHLSPDWRLALGSLVLVRLFWPWQVSTPVSLFNVTAPLMAPVSAWSLPLDGWNLIGSVWCAGVAIRVAAALRDGLRVRRWIAQSRPVDDRLSGIWSRVVDGGPRLGRRVPIRQSSAVEGPCVAGVFRPCLLLPDGWADHLSEAEIRLVLLHEAAHLRRGDPLWNALLESLHALHWFNPVVTRILMRLREDREEACDLHALSTPEVDRLQYGRVLLKCLERPTAVAVPVAVCGWRGRTTAAPRSLAHRVEAIARFCPSRRTWLAGACTVLAVALLGLTDHEPLPPHPVWRLQPGTVPGFLPFPAVPPSA
jgi:bla regulator protein BlaR1